MKKTILLLNLLLICTVAGAQTFASNKISMWDFNNENIQVLDETGEQILHLEPTFKRYRHLKRTIKIIKKCFISLVPIYPHKLL